MKDTQKLEDPMIIKDRVLRLSEEWRGLKDAPLGPAARSPVQNWRPTEEGWVKANADRAISKTLDFGGEGAVLRYHHGAFLAGRQ